jgi:hypothetical protein
MQLAYQLATLLNLCHIGAICVVVLHLVPQLGSIVGVLHVGVLLHEALFCVFRVLGPRHPVLRAHEGFFWLQGDISGYRFQAKLTAIITQLKVPVSLLMTNPIICTIYCATKEPQTKSRYTSCDIM